MVLKKSVSVITGYAGADCGAKNPYQQQADTDFSIKD